MGKYKEYLPWIFLGILSLIWGSSFILIKRGLVVFSPLEVSALRMVFAGLALTPIAVTYLNKVPKKKFLPILSVGLVGSLIPAFLFATAQTKLESSITGVLNALTPMFTLITGVIFFKQKTNKFQILGLILALVGSIILILKPDSFSLNFYAFFVVAACLMYALNVNVIKFQLSEINPFAIASLSIFLVLPVSLIQLFVFTGFLETVQINPNASSALFYLGILGVIGTAFAMIIFNKTVQLTSPLFTSSVTYIIPIVAISWGVWDGENLTSRHFIGIALILLGLYLTNKKK